jgi:hypothetical protein
VTRFDPLARRFCLAGAVVIVGGAAIAVVQKGVGPFALWKGLAIIAAGIGLIVTGVLRKMDS